MIQWRVDPTINVMICKMCKIVVLFRNAQYKDVNSIKLENQQWTCIMKANY